MSNKNNNNLTPLRVVMVIFSVLINAGFIYLFFNLTKFSSFSKPIFILINILALLLLLVFNIIVMNLIRTRKRKFVVISLIMAIVLSLFSGYGVYAINTVNKNIDKITSTGEVEESVETAFVEYSEDSNFKFSDEKDLDGKTIGIVSASQNTALAKEKLEVDNIVPSYVEYDSNNDLLLALFGGEVEAAVLPSNYVQIFEVNDGYEEYLNKTNVISSFSKVVTTTIEKGAEKDVTKEPFTVLILGVDEGRSDSMILASFNPISLKLTLTSIPRDTYTPIACYRGNASDKLAHARVSSRQCTIDTVEQLMGIDIDYYFESNFTGIVQMVDALDGVVVNNPVAFIGQKSDERGKMVVPVPAGDNVVLNGEQALAFARERHAFATGDFARESNQQVLIKAIIAKAIRTADLNKLLNVLNIAGKNFSTNIQVNQLIDLYNLTMKKAARYYDKDHPDNVIMIEGSRVTGYPSMIWNDSSEMAMSIVRLYKGSIEDNKRFIKRNLDLESEFSSEKWLKWQQAFSYIRPTISPDYYNETKVVDVLPDLVENFIGKKLADMKTWADSKGVILNVSKIDCKKEASACTGIVDNNIILTQDPVKSKRIVEGLSINVTVSSNLGNEPGEYDITVHYLYEDGTKVFDDMIYKSNKEDGRFKITPLEKVGYYTEPSKFEDVATKELELTFVYKKIDENYCKASNKFWDKNKLECVEFKTCDENSVLDAETNTCVPKKPDEPTQPETPDPQTPTPGENGGQNNGSGENSGQTNP